jgi:hypothetical protein
MGNALFPELKVLLDGKVACKITVLKPEVEPLKAN